MDEIIWEGGWETNSCGAKLLSKVELNVIFRALDKENSKLRLGSRFLEPSYQMGFHFTQHVIWNWIIRKLWCLWLCVYV